MRHEKVMTPNFSPMNDEGPPLGGPGSLGESLAFILWARLRAFLDRRPPTLAGAPIGPAALGKSVWIAVGVAGGVTHRPRPATAVGLSRRGRP